MPRIRLNDLLARRCSVCYRCAVEKTGSCLCGAVKYTAEIKPKVSACHCVMCRRWTGGPLLSASAKDIRWTGEEKLQVFASSDWAERGFCTGCGSSLFYRLTVGEYAGGTVLAYGTLDDQTGFEFDREWFFDKKPDAYTFHGERKTVTEEEAFAMLNG